MTEEDVVAKDKLPGSADEPPETSEEVMGPMLGPDVEINVDALIPRNAAEKVGSASIDIVLSTGELIWIVGVVGGGACCEGDGGGGAEGSGGGVLSGGAGGGGMVDLSGVCGTTGGAGGSFGGSLGAAGGVGGGGIRPSGGSEAGACEDDDITVGDAVGVGGTT